MNKKKWIALGVFALLILGMFIYFLINEFPSDFLKEEELIGILNSVDEKIEVEVIQDLIFMDDKHVFVPFISKDEDYGFSLWKWKNGKWHLSEKRVSGLINFIQLKENDPTSYYFVWNLPGNNISAIKLYMIRERDYRITNGLPNYQPRVQMERLYKKDTTYGVEPLPDEMLEVYQEIIEMNDNVEDFFMFPINNDLYFTSNIYDENGEVIVININGYSYIGDVMIKSDDLFPNVPINELEYPNR